LILVLGPKKKTAVALAEAKAERAAAKEARRQEYEGGGARAQQA
jgi:hypothetical protein